MAPLNEHLFLADTATDSSNVCIGLGSPSGSTAIVPVKCTNGTKEIAMHLSPTSGGEQNAQEPAFEPDIEKISKEGSHSPIVGGERNTQKYTTRIPSPGDIVEIARDIASHHHIEQVIENVACSPGHTNNWDTAWLDKLIADKPEFDELPFTRSQSCDGSSGNIGCIGNGSTSISDTLSDVNDEELDTYLLDDEEQKNKSDIWHECNKDFLEELYMRSCEKQRKKKQNGRNNTSSEPSNSQSMTGSMTRRTRGSKRSLPASSCTQSVIMALAKKGKIGSSRIDREALESLFS